MGTDIKTYILKCFKYIKNRIYYYYLYNNLKLLSTPPKFFYIININIIIDFPSNIKFLGKYKYNMIILIIYYLNK